jgi:hypothetical protein
MTKLITTALFILLVLALSAQTKDKTIFVGNVISDTTTFRSNNYRLELPSILKSKNKIEIRLISSPSSENINEYANYTILIFNKKWDAKFYYYEPDTTRLFPMDVHAKYHYYKPDTTHLFFKNINSKTDLDTIFSRLVSNNIFSLPNQINLKTEKYEFNPETNEFMSSIIKVTDGTCYYVEFKVGDFYRRYSYCNPYSYADFYPQVHELRDFANIVEIFKDLTKN